MSLFFFREGREAFLSFLRNVATQLFLFTLSWVAFQGTHSVVVFLFALLMLVCCAMAFWANVSVLLEALSQARLGAEEQGLTCKQKLGLYKARKDRAALEVLIVVLFNLGLLYMMASVVSTFFNMMHGVGRMFGH